MALGILEPRGEDHVPGTVVRDTIEQQNHAGLLRDKSGKHILVPQPSDDPNDPLVCSTFLAEAQYLTFSRTGP